MRKLIFGKEEKNNETYAIFTMVTLLNERSLPIASVGK